jgi:ferredoxin, 2Fe-2S
MPTIIFIDPDGRLQRVDAGSGESAMMAATRHGITRIVGECGGNAMCATCHVYVDEGWIGRLQPMNAEEDALLDGTAADRLSNSRLSCQIRIAPELDGLVLRLPDKQV